MSGDLRCRRLIIGAPRRSSAVQRMASGLVWLFCVILAGPATANTITVNTPVDQNPSAVDGLCSLREAIQAVMDTSPQDGCPAGSPEGPPNSFTGRDTINFSVTGTIALAAPLPTLNDIDDGLSHDQRSKPVSGIQSIPSISSDPGANDCQWAR
jgi:CSLREA domain-containing protein